MESVSQLAPLTQKQEIAAFLLNTYFASNNPKRDRIMDKLTAEILGRGGDFDPQKVIEAFN